MSSNNTTSEITSQQSAEIITLVTTAHERADIDYYFTAPVVFKQSPHTEPIEIWGIAISPKNDIWLRTIPSGNWDKLEPTDAHYQAVIASLYQRVTIELKK